MTYYQAEFEQEKRRAAKHVRLLTNPIISVGFFILLS